jgi:L-ascorbate metabolism protein UlaG (beta-lactamase superfamily)
MSTDTVDYIHWLGHDSFRVDVKGVVIYLDPWQLDPNSRSADLILITHDHRDHCSPEDVSIIQNQDTVIVTVAAAAEKLSGKIEVVEPGSSLTIKGIKIEAVPAYNLNKFRSPGVPFHPKGKNFVGFILEVNGQRIYHAGDTDVIPEMDTFEVDIALLPVSGTYVMTVDEAVEAAELIGPQIAIPMHVGRGIGGNSDAEAFKTKSAVPVKILPLES